MAAGVDLLAEADRRTGVFPTITLERSVAIAHYDRTVGLLRRWSARADDDRMNELQAQCTEAARYVKALGQLSSESFEGLMYAQPLEFAYDVDPERFRGMLAEYGFVEEF